MPAIFRDTFIISTVPVLFNFGLDINLYIPEEFYEYVNVIPLIRGEKSSYFGYNTANLETPTWSNYYRFYGDGDLYWEGELPNDNISIRLPIYFFYIEDAWRARYYKKVGQYYYVYWDAACTIPIEYVPKKFLPIGYPYYDRLAYPPVGMFSTIVSQKNIPDAEYFGGTTNYLYNTIQDRPAIWKTLTKQTDEMVNLYIEGNIGKYVVPAVGNMQLEKYQYTMTYPGGIANHNLDLYGTVNKVCYIYSGESLDITLLISVKKPNNIIETKKIDVKATPLK